MSLVFSPCTGAAEVVRAGCTENDFLLVSIDSDSFTQEFILTGTQLEMSGNYQFLHTVNDFVYFYAFGDRVGLLTLTGVSFLNTCDAVEKDGAKLFRIYDWYHENKSAARGGKSLDVVLTPPKGDPVRLHGFLTGVKLDLQQGNTGPIGYWTLRMEVLPQKTTAGGAAGGGGGGGGGGGF
jgi:hypothetical protein